MEEEVKAKLKEEGKAQLELIAQQGVKSTFAMIYAYISATDNQVDDAVIPFLQMVEKALLDQTGKIDGVQD